MGNSLPGEMHILQEEHSDIFEKFREGKHTIHRSADPRNVCAEFGPAWE